MVLATFLFIRNFVKVFSNRKIKKSKFQELNLSRVDIFSTHDWYFDYSLDFGHLEMENVCFKNVKWLKIIQKKIKFTLPALLVGTY